VKQKILVADDEECVHRLIARALENARYELIIARDGAEAMELAKSAGPDLVVLDVRMPRKNGWEVLRELRLQPRTRATPVIMLTGCSDLADEVEGLEMGADDYITKPFEINDLRARVTSVLRRNQINLCANPLTRLPGNPSIEEEVNRRIALGRPFAFLYADIDRFKPYNDVYGFARGDGVIRATADVLIESIRASEAKEAFLGHVGGDDFVIVTEPDSAPHVAQRATSGFDRKVVSFYDAGDLSRGYIESTDRQGVRRRFPLLSLSIGVVTTQRRRLEHYAKVVSIAAEMKAYCKSLERNRFSRFAFDRRKDDET